MLKKVDKTLIYQIIRRMVIPENEKTKVVFSSLFERHYPKLALELSNIMRPYHKVFRALSCTKDYWVRDFMPIQVNENVFIKFVYPQYGNHIYQLQMREFIAENGGALNCITWTLKEDIWKN